MTKHKFNLKFGCMRIIFLIMIFFNACTSDLPYEQPQKLEAKSVESVIETPTKTSQPTKPEKTLSNPNIELQKSEVEESWLDKCFKTADQCGNKEWTSTFKEGCYNYNSLNHPNASDESAQGYIDYLQGALCKKVEVKGTWLEICLQEANKCTDRQLKGMFEEGCTNYYSLNHPNLTDESAEGYLNYLKDALCK